MTILHERNMNMPAFTQTGHTSNQAKLNILIKFYYVYFLRHTIRVFIEVPSSNIFNLEQLSVL